MRKFCRHRVNRWFCAYCGRAVAAENMLDILIPLCVISLLLISAVGEMPAEEEGMQEEENAHLDEHTSNGERRGSDVSVNADERAHRSKRQAPVASSLLVTLDFMLLLFIIGVVIAVIIGIHLCRLYDQALSSSEVPYWKLEGDTELSEKFTFGPSSRKLAYSAQMYHYEQQKRRIIEEEQAASSASAPTDVATDEESNSESYVVYEYPGLASTEDLEIQNPLFKEDDDISVPSSHIRILRNGSDPDPDDIADASKTGTGS